MSEKKLTLEEQIRQRGDVCQLPEDDPDRLYIELCDEIRKYHPSTDDLSLIEKAYRLADLAHNGVARKSGQPYIIHPLHVGIILAQLRMDKECIAAGLLHDVIEDTTYSHEDMADMFSEEIAELVEGVTKLTDMKYKWADKDDKEGANMRKMITAMDKDIRVVLIKLSDRLHNMRTMEYMKPAKQIEKSRETLDFYSPLAGNLGLSKLKVDLDDYALRYLRPDDFARIQNYMDVNREKRRQFIEKTAEDIRKQLLIDYGIEAKVFGKEKHIFSIYRKMRTHHMMLEQVWDTYVIRVIVKTRKECYPALGTIHSMFKPVEHEFKDFIAVPKPNGYQSIHTTVHSMGDKKNREGVKFDVQIRSEEMNAIAEYGIAAHWKYKEGQSMHDEMQAEAAKLEWMQNLLLLQQSNQSNKDFIQELRNELNLFNDTVNVFTPKGEIVTLPADSSIVDYAYKIHTDLGNHLIGAIVDEQVVPIEYKLKNGNHITVLTDTEAHPDIDWLKLCKSPQARSKIKQWFKNNPESAEEGTEGTASGTKGYTEE